MNLNQEKFRFYKELMGQENLENLLTDFMIHVNQLPSVKNQKEAVQEMLFYWFCCGAGALLNGGSYFNTKYKLGKREGVQ